MQCRWMDTIRRVLYALERTLAKEYDTKIHPQVIIDSKTLEGLNKCKFNISSREAAIKLHQLGKLIPENLDIAIWTDGS